MTQDEQNYQDYLKRQRDQQDSGGGLLDTFLKYNPATAGPYAIGDKLDILGTHAKENAQNLLDEQSGLRAQSKATQYGLLDKMQAPQMTPQQEARIKALEAEGNQPILSQDPYFQGSRAQLVSGGQNALASIQNKDKAYGVQGGFSNIGSKNDVYDRLGMQLAQLGQQSTQHAAQSRDLAAQARQDYQNSVDQYNNSILASKQAIEAGDSQSAMAALNQAYAARENAQKRLQQMAFGVAGLGVSAMSGNPAPAIAGVREMQQADAAPQVPTSNLIDYGSPKNTYAASYKPISYYKG